MLQQQSAQAPEAPASEASLADAAQELTEAARELSQAVQKLSYPPSQLLEIEVMTMSEIGTKLDLARDYMDAGDPESASSILEEVLREETEAKEKFLGAVREREKTRT